MKKLASKIIRYVPDVPFFNWLILIMQATIYHRNPLYLFSTGLNAYLLREKIRSHELGQYTDKIRAKDSLANLLGKDVTPRTISIVDSVVSFPVPSGDWIFKSSHNCSGGIIYKDGTLTCAKRILLKDPIENPTEEDIHSVLRKFIETSKHQNLFWTTREACYKSLEPRYFFEELLVDSDRNFFLEIKFHCIKGRVELGYLVVDRHGKNKRAIVDRFGSLLPVSWCKPRDLYKYVNNEGFTIPDNWSELVDFAENIAINFECVRVDLYTDGTDIKVGELTFFHGSGLEPITPRSIDMELGKKLCPSV
jgi:hypothetical protein